MLLHESKTTDKREQYDWKAEKNLDGAQHCVTSKTNIVNKICFWGAKQLLDQIFFCDPVVLESICHHTRAKRLINEGNKTGGLRKIWMGY